MTAPVPLSGNEGPSSGGAVAEGLGSPAWQTVDAWIRAAESCDCAEFAVQNVSDLYRLREDIANIAAHPHPVQDAEGMREKMARIIDAAAFSEPVPNTIHTRGLQKEAQFIAFAKATAILAALHAVGGGNE